MMSIINDSFQKINTLARKAIGKKTIIFIGIVNLGLVFHYFIRPEIRKRRQITRSKEADYIYEMEKSYLQPK